MSYFKRKAARESLVDDLVPDSINLEAPEENLDAQLAELPSLEAEMDEIDAASDVLESDIEKVEGHVDVAEAAIDEGEELDEGTVAQIEVSQESIRRRYGINSARVARESFRSGSRGATKVAHESWKDTLKDLWQRFLDLLKAARRKIIETKLKYFNAGKSAQSRSKKYTKLMDKVGSEKSKEEISGAFLGYLAVNRKFNLDESISIASSMGGKAATALATLTAQCDSATINITKGESEFKDSNGAALDMGGVSSKFTQLSGLDGDITDYKVAAFPGDIYVQYGEAAKGTGESAIKLSVMVVISGGDKPDDTSMATPTHGDIRKAITGLNKVGLSFEKLLKDFDAYDKKVESLEKAVETLTNKFDKATEDTDRETLQAQRIVARSVVDNYKAANRLAKSVNATVIKGLDGFIKAGMGAYKKSKK